MHKIELTGAQTVDCLDGQKWFLYVP